MSYHIQSVLFDKNNYTLDDCLNFLANNHYKIKKIDETEKYYRFRQISPTLLKNRGFTRIRTKTIANGTIKLIIYYM
jgi:hypothetical protein